MSDSSVTTASGYTLYLNNGKTSGDVHINTGSPNSTVFVDKGYLVAPLISTRSADQRVSSDTGYTLYLNNDKTSGDVHINTGSSGSQTFVDHGSVQILNGTAILNSPVQYSSFTVPTSTSQLGYTNRLAAPTYVQSANTVGGYGANGDPSVNLPPGVWLLNYDMTVTAATNFSAYTSVGVVVGSGSGSGHFQTANAVPYDAAYFPTTNSNGSCVVTLTSTTNVAFAYSVRALSGFVGGFTLDGGFSYTRLA